MLLHVTPFVGVFRFAQHQSSGDVFRRVWNRVWNRQGRSPPPATLLFHARCSATVPVPQSTSGPPPLIAGGLPLLWRGPIQTGQGHSNGCVTQWGGFALKL